MRYSIGTARTLITPPQGVELAGLGYYLHRTWERVRDDLTATALVISDGGGASVALVAVDLMYNHPQFTKNIREQVAAHTDLRPDSICVNASHSHNAPTAGFIRGAGELNAEYLEVAGRQIALAIILAWRNRKPSNLYAAWTDLAGITYNRTREGGPVDTRVSVLLANGIDGRPLAIAVNFHGHPCVHMEADYRAVSRDVAGEVVDQLEAALPGVTGLYFQGTGGDVNFLPHDSWSGPASAVTGAVLRALARSRPVETSGMRVVTRSITLPTRRWTREELMREREEGLYRIQTGDTTGWLDGMARAIVNNPQRLPERYEGSVERAVAAVSRFAVEWTDQILPELDSRPETLETEVQAIRVGDLYFAAHPAELFSTLGLDLRQRWPHDDLFVLGYSNSVIGYMPDEYDILRRGYGAYTSPKCTGQFPFTSDSGPALIEALREGLQRTEA